MKTSHVVALIIFLLLGAFVVMQSKKNTVVENTPRVVLPTEQVAAVTGCYTAVISKDVYTMNIQAQEGKNVSGRLAFKNFQKDSSSGTFVGTYKDGILLGDYSFQSEGADSVTEVIFKKSGDNFIRGYGNMDASGTRFADLNNITYDSSSPLSVFNKTECVE